MVIILFSVPRETLNSLYSISFLHCSFQLTDLTGDWLVCERYERVECMKTSSDIKRLSFTKDQVHFDAYRFRPPEILYLRFNNLILILKIDYL